jgi:uncharacterized protein (TIGR02246 family)
LGFRPCRGLLKDINMAVKEVLANARYKRQAIRMQAEMKQSNPIKAVDEVFENQRAAHVACSTSDGKNRITKPERNNTMTQNPSSIPEAINRTNTQFMEAVRRGDAAGMAGVYTESASIFPPNADARTGREAIRAFWQGVLDLGVAEVKLETVEFEPAGESGWESGRAIITAGDGSVIDELKYVVVWQQENGAWKWHRDIWNSSKQKA